MIEDNIKASKRNLKDIDTVVEAIDTTLEFVIDGL